MRVTHVASFYAKVVSVWAESPLRVLPEPGEGRRGTIAGNSRCNVGKYFPAHSHRVFLTNMRETNLSEDVGKTTTKPGKGDAIGEKCGRDLVVG
jgi:hypothetical protein